MAKLRILIFGLTVTSSWGNGHATTYRGLMRGLADLGHDVWFFERNKRWYANNRDLPEPAYARVQLYRSLDEVKRTLEKQVRDADLVIVGSYVPEGIQLAEWITSTARGVTAFYDIDTPVTLANLEEKGCHYISRELIPRYDLYLSFTGGPILARLERVLGARNARPLYCSVDPVLYSPRKTKPLWDLGYMGTYSADRQAALEVFLAEPARRWVDGKMVVAGPQYPKGVKWPENVERINHVSPNKHSDFYASQRYTLNITRAEMRAAGYSPSVRLFEAAACGTPIISDAWRGMHDFFEPGSEILLAYCSEDVLRFARDLPENKRLEIGLRARNRVLQQHTGRQRAKELVSYVEQIRGRNASFRAPVVRPLTPGVRAV